MKHAKKGQLSLLFSIPPVVWLVLILIVLAFIFVPKIPGISNFLAITFDDFLIEDDFMIEGYTDSHWSNLGINRQVRFDGIRNQLVLVADDFGTGSTEYDINLKNRDIKTKVSFSGGFGCPSTSPFSGSFNIKLGQEILFSEMLEGRSFGNDYLIEAIKDVTDGNKFTVIVNGEAISEVIIQGDEARLSYSIAMSGSPCGTGGQQVILNIESVKSRPYFSCDVDNNEVVISDSFGEGSTFDINSLTFEPTKFCPLDFPAVVRDFRERGIKADVRGTITEQLARGKELTVPAFQAYEIRYVTKFTEEIGFRCDPFSEVYDTKTKTCVQKIFEQDFIIKDCHSEGCEGDAICRDNGVCERYIEQIVEQRCLELGCPVTFECLPEGFCVKELVKTIIPTCEDITCNAEFGEFCEDREFPVCVRPFEIVNIIREKEFIKIGKDEKLFKENMIIGDKQITSSKVEFVCDDEGQDWQSPRPDKSCWRISVNFDGNDLIMLDRDEIELNEFLNLRFIADAHYEFDEKRIDRSTNNFIVSIKNFDFIKPTPVKDEFFVIKDSSREMCFKIDNKLVNFNNDQAGYSLLFTTDLITTQPPRKIVEKELKLGESDFCIPIDSEIFGEQFYQVNPYFKLGEELFFDDEQITHNYKVVDEIPADNDVTIIEKGCPFGFKKVSDVCIEQKRCGFFCRLFRFFQDLF